MYCMYVHAISLSTQNLMERYFNRVDHIIEANKVGSRVKFMLQDVVDLRKVCVICTYVDVSMCVYVCVLCVCVCMSMSVCVCMFLSLSPSLPHLLHLMYFSSILPSLAQLGTA